MDDSFLQRTLNYPAGTRRQRGQRGKDWKVMEIDFHGNGSEQGAPSITGKSLDRKEKFPCFSLCQPSDPTQAAHHTPATQAKLLKHLQTRAATLGLQLVQLQPAS